MVGGSGHLAVTGLIDTWRHLSRRISVDRGFWPLADRKAPFLLA